MCNSSNSFTLTHFVKHVSFSTVQHLSRFEKQASQFLSLLSDNGTNCNNSSGDNNNSEINMKTKIEYTYTNLTSKLREQLFCQHRTHPSWSNLYIYIGIYIYIYNLYSLPTYSFFSIYRETVCNIKKHARHSYEVWHLINI